MSRLEMPSQVKLNGFLLASRLLKRSGKYAMVVNFWEEKSEHDAYF